MLSRMKRKSDTRALWSIVVFAYWNSCEDCVTVLKFPQLRQVLISLRCNSLCLRILRVSPYGNFASCLDMEQKDAFLYFLKLSTNKQKRKNKESFRPSNSNSISLAAVRAVEWRLVIFKTFHIIRLRLCSYFASELTNFHNWSQTFSFFRFVD